MLGCIQPMSSPMMTRMLGLSVAANGFPQTDRVATAINARCLVNFIVVLLDYIDAGVIA